MSYLLWNNYCFLISDFPSPTLFLKKDDWNTQLLSCPRGSSQPRADPGSRNLSLKMILTHLGSSSGLFSPAQTLPSPQSTPSSQDTPRFPMVRALPRCSKLNNPACVRLQVCSWLSLQMGFISRSNIIPLRLLREFSEIMCVRYLLWEMAHSEHLTNASCSFYYCCMLQAGPVQHQASCRPLDHYEGEPTE